MNAPDLPSLLSCRKCPRLANQLKYLRDSHPDYWNQPVAASGPARASILIVGLAPGMHGANKTGLPFTGDASGDLLYQTLDALDLSRSVRITNAVKCLPVKNLPSGREVTNCSGYLAEELETHKLNRSATVLALGGVAHRAVVRATGLRQVDYPFRHGAAHQLQDFILVNSYHCSRYNTQTGRLTASMFMDVLKKVRTIASS